MTKQDFQATASLTRLAASVIVVSAGSATGQNSSSAFPELKAPAPLSLSLQADDLPQVETAGAADGSAENLAKKLNNPVADLISVPLQFNYDEGFGPKQAGRILLNVQPVIPVSLNQDWNIISRTILPVVYQESLASGIDSKFGLGDTLQSLFLSPKQSTPIWGIGPVILLPTATDDVLGSEKWGAGPTGVVLVQEGPWTYGILANHLWSFAGKDDRDEVNATFLQPFLAYTTRTATTFTINTESTYDWNAEQWTVPLNAQVTQLLKLGNQPVSIGIGGRWYAEAPDGGPEWGVRFVFTFLFPK
jgi:hypothetical protein